MRIAFIGAGSVVFTRALLGDILSEPALAEVEIVLHDIDPERLETAELMARRTAEAAGARPRIAAQADRRRALDGADYVIDMIQVGGHAATMLDFAIPARYGLRQTIADTAGLGGIFRALRTIPVLLEIAAEMRELCAEAWFLNYTNPMPSLCQALFAGAPWLRAVGLCHSVQHTTQTLAGYVGVPADAVTVHAAGINHQAFLLRLEHDGTSLYPALDAAIAADPELQRVFRVELYRRLGYYVTESSEHLVEYVPWVLRHDDQIARFRTPVGEYLRRSEENLATYAEARASLRAGEPVTVEPSVEYGARIIAAIETGVPCAIYGNVENRGLITNLPDGICVEVPCLVDASGVQPTVVGALPPQCAALNRTFANVFDLTARAALDGDPRLVRWAAMLDPNAAATLTLEQIDRVVAELTLAHGDALPESLRTPAA